MASKDKAMMSLPGSPWGAILEAAKHQLPSLDSDSSLSDCEEEEPYIFQRNEPILIPDLAELLAEDPAGGDKPGTWFPVEWSSPPELLLVPGGLTTEPGSGQKEWTRDLAPQEGRVSGLFDPSYAQSSVLLAEEDPPWLEDNLASLSCNIKGYQGPPWSPQGREAISQEGELKADPSAADPTDSARRKALRRERRKMIEKDVLQKVTLETQGPACSNQGQGAEAGPRPEAPSEEPQEGWPVLSLQQLEEWDLDYILQSLRTQEDDQGDGARRTAWWLADSCQGQDLTLRRSQDRLLEQLTLPCATQSRACAPARKIPTDKSQDTTQQKVTNRCALPEPGFQAELCQKLAEDWRIKTEPPTIFIDLRQTELPGKLQPAESSEHSSSESSEEEEEDRRGEQAAAQAASSSRRLRDCTGKSQLLQQLRAFRKGMAPSQLPTSKNPGDQKAQVPEDAAELGTGRKKHIKLWSEEQSAQVRFPGGLLGIPEDLLQPESGTEAEAVSRTAANARWC
uniref:dynein axonemal assembly factor 8 isoform X1 n=1 Tax=Jaculus jaculus TaxID=51337 RepID=UPI001E1B48C1|nr:dynein axonemal assembly factor 8 isoform X1 [Jaculus jaculus]